MIVKTLLVLTILGTLVWIVILRVGSHPAKTMAAQTDIAAFVAALGLFKADNGYYPKTSDGLNALIFKPHDGKDTWKGPYLNSDKVPIDPWAQPYVYVSPGEHNPDSFDVYSKGKDGVGGKDAIGNWED
jgi:general secretion pathway protein G